MIEKMKRTKPRRSTVDEAFALRKVREGMKRAVQEHRAASRENKHG